MQHIEPFWKWRDDYIASEDKNSPFYGRTYNEFQYTNKIYNYYIHPQWDFLGSETLWGKLLFVDYEDGFAIIELLGEWNDVFNNDFLQFRKKLLDRLVEKGIYKFILLGENVLIFHPDTDDYYEEFNEDLYEAAGWVVLLNFSEEVLKDMSKIGLRNYLHFDGNFNAINWRAYLPENLFKWVELEIKNPKGKLLK
jgi:hypothetical protein